MSTLAPHDPHRYPLPFAGAEVRRVIGGFMPLRQRLECQLLLGKGGFDLGTVQALLEDDPADPDAEALRILQGWGEPLPIFLWGLDIPGRKQTWIVQAAGDGVLELVKELRAEGCPWDWRICSYAAKGGHLGVLQWLRRQTPPCPWDYHSCSYAAQGGHLEILQWLRAQGCPWDYNTCSDAAWEGHLEILQWARAQDPPCPWGGACSSAAWKGRVDVLEWLRAQDPPCPWDRFTCIHAAERGHLEVLQWARAQGCPWDEGTCRAAAQAGNLEILQWLRARGCPWDEKTCHSAAEEGHFEVLQWARAQDPPCPCDKWTRRVVMRRNLC